MSGAVVANGQGNSGGAAPSVGGSSGSDDLQHAGDQIGGWISGASDWLAGKTKRPNYTGYDIDRNAFTDPYLTGNIANWNAAGGAADNRVSGEEFLNGQRDLISQLQNRANGTGPASLAEMMLHRSTDRNIAGSNALLSSARGVNPAIAARMAQKGAAGANQEAAGQASILRSQEQTQAQGLLGQVLSGARGQSQNQQAMNDQMVQFYTSLGYSEEAAQNQARQALEALEAQNQQQTNATNAGANNAYNQTQQGYIASILSGGGALGSTVATNAPQIAGAASMLNKGGMVPGKDTGMDEHHVMARGEEVFIPKGHEGYDEAKAAVENEPAPEQMAMPMAEPPAAPRRPSVPRGRASGLARKLLEHIRLEGGNMMGGAGMAMAPGVGG